MFHEMTSGAGVAGLKEALAVSKECGQRIHGAAAGAECDNPADGAVGAETYTPPYPIRKTPIRN